VERREPGLERKSQVMAANIDLGLIVQPVIEIDAARKIERFVAFLHDCSVPPLLVLTKADLIPADPELRAAVEAFVESCRERVDTLVLSNETGEGHEALAARLPAGLTAALFGASGVGKSSLLNRLSGSTLHRTALVDADGKGRHTTTHRQLVSTAEGRLLLDMPGIRELGLLNNDDLDAAFEEIATLAPNCRFRDCAHLREPDCAVRAALGQGKLTADRLDHWHKLREERLARERVHERERLARRGRHVRRGVRAPRGVAAVVVGPPRRLLEPRVLLRDRHGDGDDRVEARHVREARGAAHAPPRRRRLA
jgi:ribosome biogenesis GTPase